MGERKMRIGKHRKMRMKEGKVIEGREREETDGKKGTDDVGGENK